MIHVVTNASSAETKIPLFRKAATTGANQKNKSAVTLKCLLSTRMCSTVSLRSPRRIIGPRVRCAPNRRERSHFPLVQECPYPENDFNPLPVLTAKGNDCRSRFRLRLSGVYQGKVPFGGDFLLRKSLKLNGASGTTRTCNLLIRSQESTRNPEENSGF